MSIEMLLQEPHTLNVGLSSFAEAISYAGGKVTQIEWTPPAAGDDVVGRALAHLVNHPVVEAANRKAFDAYLAAQPRLEGVGVA
jgi:hypothetical protein